MARFGDLLSAHLRRSGLSQNRFAELAETQQSHISEVMAGLRKPSRGQVSRWATVLSLSGAEREDFVLEAAAEFLPEDLAEALRDMGKRLRALESSRKDPERTP